MSPGELNFLVVDDDDLLRLTTKNILWSLACTNNIQEASNGLQALEILRQADAPRVDIVLCGLNIRGIDSMEFIRLLGEIRFNISLIIVSSHADTQLAAVKKRTAACNVRLLGAMQKPVSRECLAAFIREHRRV